MLIITQDHDQFILAKYHELSDSLHTMPKLFHFPDDGYVCMGINLYHKNTLLGTFDTTGEAVEEMNEIMLCRRPVYLVRGYSNWRTWEDIKEIMREGEKL